MATSEGLLGVAPIADALGLSMEPLEEGVGPVASGQWVDARLPSDFFWWWLTVEDDGVLVAVKDNGDLFVCRPIRRIAGPPPELRVTAGTMTRVATQDDAIEEVRRLLRNRRRSYRRCHFCQNRTPPEYGERTEVGPNEPEAFVCHGCMSEHLGVVF